LTALKDRGQDGHTLSKKSLRLRIWLRTFGIQITLPKFRYTLPDIESYEPHEWAALIAHAKGRDKLLWETYLKSGLRMQEMLHLRYECLLDEGIKVIPHGEWQPKTYQCRIVRVPRVLIDSLRRLERVKNSPLVFPTQWGNENWHHLRSLKRCAKRAGLDPEKCWLHKFRSTFATTLLRRGVPLPDVSKQLGHMNTKTTMRYLAALKSPDLQKKIEEVWS
jgi:integrase/recombinase XerD